MSDKHVRNVTLIMALGLIGVPVAVIILEEMGGPALVRTAIMGTLIMVLLNILTCFVWWVGRGVLRKLRDRPSVLSQTFDSKVDTSTPIGVWFPDGVDGEAFVVFPSGEGVVYIPAKGEIPVGFKIGMGLRYRDPETGGVYTLPTKEGDLS